MSEFSPYYPYVKVQSGYDTYRGTEKIPQLVAEYLLDLPDAYGYEPRDDNDLPRCRLWKLLLNDGENPLGGELPNAFRKRACVFDPAHPNIDSDRLQVEHPDGYRIFPFSFWLNTQTDATTTVKIYLSNERPANAYRSEIGVVFDILTNTTWETNTRTDALSRTYAIEQCIKEALHGVAMTGVGVWNYDRFLFPSAGSMAIHDEGTNVGRRLTMSVTWIGGNEDGTAKGYCP